MKFTRRSIIATGLGSILSPRLTAGADETLDDLPGVPVDDALFEIRQGEKILGSSYCAGCSLACPVAWVAAEGEPDSRRLVIDRRRTSGDAGLCIRGLTAGATLTVRTRVDQVRYRAPRDDRWQTLDWPEAISRIAARIRESIGAIRWDIGSVLTSEEALAAAMLARATGATREMIHTSADPGFDAWFQMVGRFEDPSRSASSPDSWVGRELIILIGSDLAVSHATATAKLLKAKERGAKVVVIDPRFSRTATLADLHIKPLPGSDPILLRSLLGAIQTGVVDNSIDQLLSKTCVDPANFLRLVQLVKESSKSAARGLAIVFGSGVTVRRSAVDAIHAAVELQKAIGGRPDRVGIIGGEPNLRGTARVLSAVDFSAEDRAADQTTRGMFVLGRNPAVGYNAAREILPGLEQLEWLVVSDLFKTETAGFWYRPDADPDRIETEVFLLPARHALEKPGRMIAATGPVRRELMFEPPDGSRSDLWILDQIAGAAVAYNSRPDLGNDESKLWTHYANRLEQFDGDNAASSEAKTWSPSKGASSLTVEEADVDDKSPPMLAYFARMGELGHGGCFSRNSSYLLELVPGPFVEISREAARSRGIKNGNLVRVESNRGVVEVHALITDRVVPLKLGDRSFETICLVGHFGYAGLRPAVDLFQIAESDDRPTVCRLSVVPQSDPWREI